MTPESNPPPAHRAESAWPLVLGVTVAALAVAFALVAKSGWRPGATREQAQKTFAGDLRVLCRHADGSVTSLTDLHACPTSASLDVMLTSTDPRVKFGAWVLMGGGNVAAGNWTFPPKGGASMPLSRAMPGAVALIGLYSDRAFDIRNLYEYVSQVGEEPEHVLPQLEQLERRLARLRRSGHIVGLRAVTFQVRRG